MRSAEQNSEKCTNKLAAYLDRIDIRLLGQLARGMSAHDFQPEVKGVYGRIAKKLGLDEDTVRKRMERLESTGVIRGWQVVLNPNVLGLKMFVIWMSVSPQLRVEEAVRKIRLVHGVASIARLVGDVLGVGIFCESEQVFRRSVGLISELAETKELTTYVVDQPGTEVELTTTDWQIIKALRPDPLVRYSEMAKKLGLSSRTVTRRLLRLLEGNVVFFLPNIDFGLCEGLSCVDLFVTYTASSLKREVDRSIFTKFEDYILRAGWGSANYGHFEFLVPNVRVAQEIVVWTRGLRGVREARLNFVYDRQNFFDDAQDEVIASRVSPIP